MFASAGHVQAIGTRPERVRDAWGCLAAVGGFALLTALLARVALPVPGTAVPLTLQTVAVLLSGVALGGRLGGASQALYVVAGIAGLPVFAPVGAGVTVTGGYLVGFVAAAWVVGAVYRRLGRSLVALAAACVAGQTIIFILGAGWLCLLAGGNVDLAIRQGVWPFFLGDGLKVLVTVAAVRAARSSRAILDYARKAK